MKFTKAKFTVQSPIKITVEQQLEGEAKGREAYLLALKGNLPEAKLKNLFSSADAFNALVASHYDDNGALLHQDGGKQALNVEGRACKASILWGPVDAVEFEDCVFDSIKIQLAEGRVVEVWARLRLHPTAKQASRVIGWAKEEITLSINGETVMCDAQDEEQQELELGGGEAPDGHGEVKEGDEDRPSLKESLAEFEGGAAAPAKPAGKPSVQGEPVVPGQKPPQRPRHRKPPETTIQ